MILLHTKMHYTDIKDEIKPFIPFDDATFNEFDDNIREIIYAGARVKWLDAGAPQIDSIRYPIEESYSTPDSSHWNEQELTDFFYEHYVKGSTVGIDDYIFTIRSSLNQPSLWQFMTIVDYWSRNVNATNATLSYLDNDDILHHLSFCKNDLQKYTVNELLHMLKMGSKEWHYDAMYAGSDTVNEYFKAYRLSIERFTITVMHDRGGYGKMIADYYDTLGLENNEDDCLIQCFQYIYNIQYPNTNPPSVDTIRSISLKEGKLGIDIIPWLEDLFRVKVGVVKDYRDIDIQYISPPVHISARILPYTDFKAHVIKDEEIYLYGDKHCQWKLLYKDEHYDVVTHTYRADQCLCPHTGNMLPKRKPFTKQLLKKKIFERYYADSEKLSNVEDSDHDDHKDTYYYFFDYETVFDPKTMYIVPYAYAIIKCDSMMNILDTRYKIGLDCNKHLSIYLSKETPKDGEIKYLIGYNNSRFDNFILIRYGLINNDFIGHTRFAGNTIISANINKFAIRDLCRILNMSLDAACKAFKIVLPKMTGALKHHEVQFAYMGNHFSDYLSHHHDSIKDYVIRDCVCLADLYKVTKTTMMTLLDLNLDNHYTLAGMSYKAFKSTVKTIQLPVLNNGYINEDALVRKAIIGGRAQMQCISSSDMCAIDCVSLYPYVMLNRMFPIGLPHKSECYVSGKIGVYNVTINTQRNDKLNVIPLRGEDDRLNWDHKGKIECVLCNVDIDCLIRHGADISIGKGIYWDESRKDVFDQYFKNLIITKKQHDLWREENSEHYNTAIREICKLLMNALSGKLAQRLYNTETNIVKNANEIDRFCNRTISGTQTFVPLGSAYIARGRKQSVPTMPVIYGVLIYAYAREHMYESVLKHLNIDELYGMDTDSAFIKNDTLMKIPRYLLGNDFGQFKIELDNVDGIFIAPKCYCFYKDDGIVKARFKGVKVGQDVELTEEMEDPIQLYRYYHRSISKRVGINTYKQLLTGDTVKIVCCNIEKSVQSINKNIGLYLANHTFIKYINVDEQGIEVKSRDDVVIIN